MFFEIYLYFVNYIYIYISKHTYIIIKYACRVRFNSKYRYYI